MVVLIGSPPSWSRLLRQTARSTTHPEGAVTRTDSKDWYAEGTYFEACNCLPICPCRQVGGRDGGRSTLGVCEFALSWWIVRGRAGELDLAGQQVVMVGRYDDDEPGSPWTVTLFLDRIGSDAQREVLAEILLGRMGGTRSRNYAPV